MNPDTTIRPWLLAAAKYINVGTSQAHDYRYKDATTRPGDIYFEYMVKSSKEESMGGEDLSTIATNTVTHVKAKRWFTTAEIKLFNSQNGMQELAEICVGGQMDNTLRLIFSGKCSPPRNCTIENESIVHDDRTEYVHKLVCVFAENIVFEHVETNASVDQIDLTLEAGDLTHEITRSGITVT